MLRGPIFHLFQLDSLGIFLTGYKTLSDTQSKELHFLSKQITATWTGVTAHCSVLISNISCCFSARKRGWGRTAVLRNQGIYKFQQKQQHVFLSTLNRGYWGHALQAALNCQILHLSTPESAVKCNSRIFSTVIYIWGKKKTKKVLGAWTFQTTWPQAMVKKTNRLLQECISGEGSLAPSSLKLSLCGEAQKWNKMWMRFWNLSEHSLGLELTQSSFPSQTPPCLHGCRKGILTAGGWWRICHFWGSSCRWAGHHPTSYIYHTHPKLPQEGQGGQNTWDIQHSRVDPNLHSRLVNREVEPACKDSNCPGLISIIIN